ncbi:CST complex subunit Ten1 [Lophiotrema nucula]|uniref:CST complex subunit Ten1 n=1 Tax=Lophiotrema nucula TaxID=690887 RepID=A0A6A5ZK87_9PLEO|nr:CST complex subunit Ten1 [Lophiotrema nucula]
MSGPVPSKLVRLNELEGYEKGAKVRFLGCVDEYVVSEANLRLKHNYPPSNDAKTANVNIVHVLESIKRANIDVGSWMNVIGYVERRKEKGIFVQAIAVWDAGNVDLVAYQKAVEARKEAG